MANFTRIFLALVVWLASGQALQAGNSRPFDYYVLALSWSPTYCASSSGKRDNQQCRGGRRFAFVVHGLWPQYNHGWPKFCKTNERWIPKQQIRDMLDIMPSKKLIIHEWKKHGACARIGQEAYFKLVRKLFKKVLTPARYLSPRKHVLITPQKLVSDFVKTNRGLSAQMLSVQCGNTRDRGQLSELRVCFSKSGEFTNCGANERRHCQARTLVLPPVR